MLKKVKLYTDGACSGNPGVGGYGAVLIYGTHEKCISGVIANTTNNRMEMMAVIEGLRCLKEVCEVDVYSDSSYLVSGFERGWVYTWERNNWKKGDGKPVLNVDLWKDLLLNSRFHHITFHKVKGHADDDYNNLCDKMATDAIKAYKAENEMD